MSATEKRLGELHEKVAEVLIDALDGEELPGYTDPETEEVVPAKRLAPSAAIIAAATKFLKDNEITCVVSDSNALGALEARMAERRAKRASATKVDFDEAKEASTFRFGG